MKHNLKKGAPLKLLSDSQYSIDSIKGNFGKRNQQIILHARKVYDQARLFYRCRLAKIRAHQNHRWNEGADEVANIGRKLERTAEMSPGGKPSVLLGDALKAFLEDPWLRKRFAKKRGPAPIVRRNNLIPRIPVNHGPIVMHGSQDAVLNQVQEPGRKHGPSKRNKFRLDAQHLDLNRPKNKYRKIGSQE